MALDDCLESGLLLRDDVQIIAIAEHGAGYAPISLPIRGAFDREDGLRVPAPDALASAVLRLAPQLDLGRDAPPPAPTVTQLLDLLHRASGTARIGDRAVSIALFDAGIFRAIAAQLDDPALATMPLDDLLAHVLPIAELSRYDHLRATAPDELRAAALDLAGLLAGRSLAPSYDDTPAFYGYFPLIDPSEAPAACARARARYAGRPALLAAVDENERAWQLDAAL